MAEQEPRELFLIDGNSLVYRAFFALPETIATSKGPSGAWPSRNWGNGFAINGRHKTPRPNQAIDR